MKLNSYSLRRLLGPQGSQKKKIEEETGEGLSVAVLMCSMFIRQHGTLNFPSVIDITQKRRGKMFLVSDFCGFLKNKITPASFCFFGPDAFRWYKNMLGGSD